MNSQSVIIASGQHALERETQLVITNLKSLLLVIASTYGICIDEDSGDNKSNMDKGIAESGTLTPPPPTPTPTVSATATTTVSATVTAIATATSTVSSHDKTNNCVKSNSGLDTNLEDGKTTSATTTTTTTDVNENNKVGSGGGGGDDAIMVDDNINNNNSMNNSNHVNEVLKSSKNALNKIEITRQMFEHLSFLFTTSSKSDGSFRSMSTIVPQWNDIGNTSTINLIELVDVITIALTRVATQEINEGVIDVVDISDLERKTVIRTSMPRTNQTCIDRKFKNDLVNHANGKQSDDVISKQEIDDVKDVKNVVQVKTKEDNDKQIGKEEEKDKQDVKELEKDDDNDNDDEKEYRPDVRIWNCSDSHI